MNTFKYLLHYILYKRLGDQRQGDTRQGKQNSEENGILLENKSSFMLIPQAQVDSHRCLEGKDEATEKGKAA